jgi:hypothetical protein
VRKLLVSVVAALGLMAVATPAQAMGVYVNFDVVAWNDDGTSAIVSRDTSSSGTTGSTHAYILVSAGEPPALVVRFTDLQDPDKQTEHIDRAACTKAAAAFATALGARRFHGVTVTAAACGTAARDVVRIDATAARLAALAWVATPAARPATDREQASAEAARQALGPTSGAGGTGWGVADVASLTGRLILIVTGGNGDSSTMGHLAVYARTKGSVAQQIADLRDLP